MLVEYEVKKLKIGASKKQCCFLIKDVINKKIIA